MTTTTRATSPEKNREREEKQITIFQPVEQETEQARPTTTKAKSRTQKKTFQKKKKPFVVVETIFRPWRTRRNKYRRQSSTESRHARPARGKSDYPSLTPRDLLFPFGAAFFLRCPDDAIGGEPRCRGFPSPPHTHFLLHHHHFFPLLHQYFPIIRTTQLNANTQNGSYQRARGERNRERAERERERERERKRGWVEREKREGVDK